MHPSNMLVGQLHSSNHKTAVGIGPNPGLPHPLLKEGAIRWLAPHVVKVLAYNEGNVYPRPRASAQYDCGTLTRDVVLTTTDVHGNVFGTLQASQPNIPDSQSSEF